MRKNFAIIFSITTLIGLFSCGNKVERVYYPNGQLKFVGKVINELPEGICSTYYENGNIMQISEWHNGKMNGPRKYYYKNGILKEKSYWKNDSLDGWASFYSPNGKVSIVGKYRNGEGNGWFKYYDSGGKLLSMIEYFLNNGETLVNQEIKFDKNGGIDKSKSNYYIIKPNVDTLIQNKDYHFNVLLEGSLYKQNMRVILDESLSSSESDTIEGKGMLATVIINPKRKGVFKLYGRVQEYTSPIITPKGFSYKSRDLFFEKQYFVK
jgi:hypothetical protein